LSRPLLEMVGLLDPNGFPAALVETEAVAQRQPGQGRPGPAKQSLGGILRSGEAVTNRYSTSSPTRDPMV
jgi:hypothetical protein